MGLFKKPTPHDAVSIQVIGVLRFSPKKNGKHPNFDSSRSTGADIDRRLVSSLPSVKAGYEHTG